MEAGNFLVVISAATKTYPVLFPLALAFAPWKVMYSLRRMISEARVQIANRIKRRYDLKHSDYFEQLLPPEKPSPTAAKQMRHMLTVAGQLVLGGYDPTSVAIYMAFFLLLQNPQALERLREEVRVSFASYEDIESEKLRTLPWLNACMHETLRLSASATHHSLPRISPGAMVNGEYIPQGVSTTRDTPSYTDTCFVNPISPIRSLFETLSSRMVAVPGSSMTPRSSGQSDGFQKTTQTTVQSSPRTTTVPIFPSSSALDSAQAVKLHGLCSGWW